MRFLRNRKECAAFLHELGEGTPAANAAGIDSRPNQRWKDTLEFLGGP